MPLPKELHAKYGTHIPFTEDGFPDLFRFARKKVTIKIQGNRRLDDLAANKAAGFTPPTTPATWSWHHHQNGESMLLVPTELHQRVGHHGSYSIYRAERGLK